MARRPVPPQPTALGRAISDYAGRWHSVWIAKHLPGAEEHFQPRGGEGRSDYNQHVVDIEAPGAAQDEFVAGMQAIRSARSIAALQLVADRLGI